MSEEASDTLQPLAGGCYFGYPQAEVAVDQHDLSAGNDLVAHYKVDRVADRAVKLHHVAGTQVENLAQGQFAAPETQGGLKFDIEEKIKAGMAAWRSRR